MKNARVAVIDTGLSPLSPVSSCVIDSYVLYRGEAGWEIQKSIIEDFVGHGTAVSYVLWNTNKNIDITIFRICNDELNVDESGLVKVLDFIYKNIEIDIINISAGVTYLYDFAAINDVCLRLSKKGVIVVSAFDNDGAISFPAALDCVLGVDVKRDLEKGEIIFVENSKLNILVADRYYRTQWLDTKTIIKGTSFACAYISGLIAAKVGYYADVVSMIHSICSKTIFQKKSKKIVKPSFKICRSIVFPVNKESHALLRFKNKLNFELVGVYDDKLSGKVGKSIFGEIVKSFDDIDWQGNFDTVILSCVSDLTALTRRNYVEEILSKCEFFGKNIYSFEAIPLSNKSFYYPLIEKNNVPIENDLKLYKVTIPVVGVVGTSSKQGKFTLQQKIIYQLSQLGYNVGSIITEPSGYLFNADYVFHFGYHATLNLNPSEYIATLNEMIFKVQLKQKDIIITGCQSGVIHYNNSNINEFAISQYSFLLGTLPDAFILCVNPHDEFDYIRKTIGFLNSIDEGKVKAIVIFPMKAVTTLSGIGYKIEEIDNNQYLRMKSNLEQEFDLPVFSMDDSDIFQICSLIIDEFSNNI